MENSSSAVFLRVDLAGWESWTRAEVAYTSLGLLKPAVTD